MNDRSVVVAVALAPEGLGAGLVVLGKPLGEARLDVRELSIRREVGPLQWIALVIVEEFRTIFKRI